MQAEIWFANWNTSAHHISPLDALYINNDWLLQPRPKLSSFELSRVGIELSKAYLHIVLSLQIERAGAL